MDSPRQVCAPEMEATLSYDTLVTTYQTARCHGPENQDISLHRSKNHKSRMNIRPGIVGLNPRHTRLDTIAHSRRKPRVRPVCLQSGGTSATATVGAAARSMNAFLNAKPFHSPELNARPPASRFERRASAPTTRNARIFRSCRVAAVFPWQQRNVFCLQRLRPAPFQCAARMHLVCS
jgi:hypothetical protein